MSDGLSSVQLVKDHEHDAWFFRELESRGVKLNKGQIELVRHKDGTALVNAVAGAGKSSSIVSRLSYLDQVHGINISKVLLITFTKEAANEMISKALKLGMTSKEKLKQVTAGTFHAVFLKVLRSNGENREILSSDKSKRIIIKMIMRSLGIDDKRYRPEDIMAQISHYKNNIIDIEDYYHSEKFDREFYNIWSRYEKHKEEKMLIDFDDMLLLTYQLLIKDEIALKSIRENYQYIMVDEFQDTNTIQMKIVELISSPLNNLLVVGDSDQAIFSFNGAKIENILNFTNTYHRTKIITLNTNYRCTDTILGIANHAIKKNNLRIEKESLAVKPSSLYPSIDKYVSTEDEAANIVNHITREVRLGKRKYSDFAVLYRTNSNSRAIFEELLLREIPFTSFSSEDVFYVNSTVKPLLGYLRVMADPYDFSAIGDILPTLYIARDKVKQIGSLQQQNPIANPIEHVIELVSSSYQQTKIQDKIDQMKRIVAHRPIVVLKSLREDYEKYLIGEDESETTSLHREIIKEILDELENSSKKFSTVKEYVAFVDRVIKNAKLQKEQKKKNNNDTVKIMTIHKSKGLEFPVVFTIMNNEGVLPHKSSFEVCTDVFNNGINEALEEENRLFYVAVTRAEDELYLSFVDSHRGRDMYPSRFIEDYIEVV